MDIPDLHDHPNYDKKSQIWFYWVAMILLIPKTYHMLGYNVKTSIKALNIIKNQFFEILDLPDHPDSDRQNKYGFTVFL